MSKQIKIKDNKNNVEYVLEYNRNSLEVMERQGFIADQFTEKPATMFPLAFKGAFLMHHSNAKTSDVEELFSTIKDKDKMMGTLMNMMNDCYHSLMNNDVNEEDAKNVSWEIVE